MNSMKNILYSAAFLALALGACKKKDSGNGGGNSGGGGGTPVIPPVVANDISYWITRGDGGALIEQQTLPLGFGTTASNLPYIDVDSAVAYQSVDGFGYTFTGGSADLIASLPAATRSSLLQELFGTTGNSIGVSYLRVSVGASDLSASVYTYNDLPFGQTDPTLAQFSLAPDELTVIPMLQAVRAVNPNIKLMATPWTAPSWMKDNGSSVGGSLLPQYYDVYARYLVKYLQGMQQRGLPIDALTVQNEPMHGGNNPSMLMTAAQQATFIKNNLGPALQAAGLTTKIIIWDHNADHPDYPIQVLNDPAAKAFIDGSAFHLYAGDISALSQVRNAHPDKNIYFTEQYTASNGSFGGDLKWHYRNVIIGSMRNWSRIALEWNLANNASFGPHTPGGCTTCKGAITISGGTISRNVAYYIIGQISKFVPPGSERIASNNSGSLYTVAFRRADGRKVLVALNDGSTPAGFNIRYKGRWASASLDAGAVGTYVW
ncbi:glycoside hydrolase family 30 protein [Flaviaesturariibacter amylovorans]|uniref:Glucosylceramidase n=1 Tax=Flaviaesturariibacter amylovorans TaxID=1084520 RepID=A0ABP8GJJ2_9BACT